ncbi:hypothetical protein KM043_011228 [Ampulex compressa]|nr:hypothetical protein KM043_011228 [Ampulex compressa]
MSLPHQHPASQKKRATHRWREATVGLEKKRATRSNFFEDPQKRAVLPARNMCPRDRGAVERSRTGPGPRRAWREARGEKRSAAPPGEPRSHPRSKLSDNLIHAAAESSICDGQRETMDEWRGGETREKAGTRIAEGTSACRGAGRAYSEGMLLEIGSPSRELRWKFDGLARLYSFERRMRDVTLRKGMPTEADRLMAKLCARRIPLKYPDRRYE